MRVKVETRKGREYLTIVKSFRNEEGKPRSKHIKSLGFLDELKNEYHDGVPLHYEIFPGNTLDKETFRSVIGQVRKNYDTGRIIAVADMGIITGDNIYYLVGSKPEKPQNGYIFSFSVRGGTKEFKQYVLDENGYTAKDGSTLDAESDFKIKERFVARDINVTMQNGKKAKKKVYEKQIVYRRCAGNYRRLSI